MDLFEVIENRRSIRFWEDEEVPDEVFEKIIDAARKAPSATNKQPWFFLVIKKRGLIKELAAIVHKRIDEILASDQLSEELKDKFGKYRKYYTFFENAPALIAVFTLERESLSEQVLLSYDAELYKHRNINTTEQSVAAAVENLLLAATALGYGTCWMTGPLVAVDLIEELLSVKKPKHLFALIPIGKPLRRPMGRALKELKDIYEIRR